MTLWGKKKNKTKNVVALQGWEGRTGGEIEGVGWREKSPAALENLSKNLQSSFIIVGVHEGFPVFCAAANHQPGSLCIFLTLSSALPISAALLLYLCHLFYHCLDFSATYL